MGESVSKRVGGSGWVPLSASMVATLRASGCNPMCPKAATPRAPGDFDGTDAGVLATPTVSHRTISPEDAFVVLASDGIWEMLSSEIVVEIVRSYSLLTLTSTAVHTPIPRHLPPRHTRLARPRPLSTAPSPAIYHPRWAASSHVVSQPPPRPASSSAR